MITKKQWRDLTTLVENLAKLLPNDTYLDIERNTQEGFILLTTLPKSTTVLVSIKDGDRPDNCNFYIWMNTDTRYVGKWILTDWDGNILYRFDVANKSNLQSVLEIIEEKSPVQEAEEEEESIKSRAVTFLESLINAYAVLMNQPVLSKADVEIIKADVDELYETLKKEGLL